MASVELAVGFRGPRGASAYQVWLEQGNTGTEAEFVQSLRASMADVEVVTGAPGTDVVYENGVLTIPTGPGAYDAWLAAGFTGTEADFTEWLRMGATEQAAAAKESADQAARERQAIIGDGAAIIGQAQQAVVAAETAGAAQVDRAAGQAGIAQTAADSALSAVHADYRGSTNDRLALTGMTADQVFYDVNTGHMWRWNGAMWDDLGTGVLATKANKSDLDVLRDEAAAPRQTISGDNILGLMFDNEDQAFVAWKFGAGGGFNARACDDMVADFASRMDLPDVDLTEVNENLANLEATKSDKTEVEAIRSEMVAPHQVIEGDGLDPVFWKEFDREGNALSGYDKTGLVAIFSEWTIANIAPRIAAQIDIPSSGGYDPTLSTTAIQIITTMGQSLSVGGDWTSTVSRAAMLSWQAANADGYALQINGLFGRQSTDTQNIAITDTLGPRGRDYVKTIAGSGFGAAMTGPGASAVGAPWPLANLVNLYRRDRELPLVPILTTAGGIGGIQIENIDPDPATGTGSTTIWDNQVYWYSEAIRLAAAAGKTVTVPWHDWVHGTSAKTEPAGHYLLQLWRYRRDYLKMLSDSGVKTPTLMVMSQPSGDANTAQNGENWYVCDEILDFCEAGGAVLATPEYAYQIADNNVHPDADWTIQFQEVKAWAIAEIEAGRQWQINRPRATVSGNVVTLQFGLRPDEYFVAHDPARYGGQGIDGNLGFEAVGATITGVELRGHQVVLTCSVPPTAVHYAMQVQDVSGFASNRWTAHRGLLRTSLTTPSKILADTTLYRWVPSFRLTL